VRRKKRIKQQQEKWPSKLSSKLKLMPKQHRWQLKSEMQKEQLKAQLEAQRLQMEGQIKAQLLEMEYNFKIQIEQMRGQFGVAEQQIESGVKMQAETEKENRKDFRIEKQAMAQSKLISQRKGERPPLDQSLSAALTGI
jgi:hypothetical protein